jgi:hypothetical protein
MRSLPHTQTHQTQIDAATSDGVVATPPPVMDRLHAPAQRGWGQAEWCAWSAGLGHPFDVTPRELTELFRDMEDEEAAAHTDDMGKVHASKRCTT